MKHIILTICLSLLLSSILHAQPSGQFFTSVGTPYTAVGASPCIVDSSLYVIRYGGIQAMSTTPDHSVRYLWNRFYNASLMRKGPGSSLIFLKSNALYEYFIAQDSVVNISASLSSPSIVDISASQSAIWAITNFNEIGKYDSTGWHIFTLPNSYNPNHIMAITDSTVYLSDLTAVNKFSPTGLAQTLYISNSSFDIKDWAIDTAQNLWLVTGNSPNYHTNLVEVIPSGNDTTYSDTTLSFLSNGETFSHLAADNSGSIYVSTTGQKLFKYNGSFWSAPTQTLSYPISCLGGDRFSDQTIVVGTDSVITITQNNTRTDFFGNMPYQNIKAVSSGHIATNQGIFDYNINGYYYTNDLTPTNFRDSSLSPYANDLTCFVINDYSSYSNQEYGYGTHHGIYGTSTPVNNAALPDSNITYIYYSGGSYYIGTQKGLCIFNQIVYTNFDTSNSGLPSNRITYITSDLSPYTNQQELWVGTDNGLALYSNGQWTRFDSSRTNIPGLYVTGILSSPYYYLSTDSTVWVSSWGKGLLKLHRDGRSITYSTADGSLLDDSLYYVIQTSACYNSGSISVGTNNHGICMYDAYSSAFSYDTTAYPYYGGNPVKYHKSDFFSQRSQSYNAQTMLVTDRGLYFVGVCVIEGISEKADSKQSLMWYQSSNEELSVKLLDDNSGQAVFQLYDMSGRQVTSASGAITDGAPTYLNITQLATGVYVLEATYDGHTSRIKVAITK